MLRMRLVERTYATFLRGPVSVRNAMAVIVCAMATSVVAGGVLVWLVDRRDFPTVWLGMWWALQTVTTVGYGDVTPRSGVGRLLGAAVMLQSIAFTAVITAAITSSFVARARQELGLAPPPDTGSTAEIATRLEDITARLERIEGALGGRRSGTRPSE